LNGTSKNELEGKYRARLYAINEAIDAIRTTDPNGRDYYPQGPDAILEALEDHHEAIQELERLKARIIKTLEGIMAQ
jgi:hypothetical protein